MHWNELHQKLIQLAKDIEVVREQHPELSSALLAIENTLTETPAVVPSHQLVSHPYHIPEKGV
jgi:hypothetical protein